MQTPVAALVLIGIMAAACSGGNDGEPAAEVTTAGAPETTTAAALEPVTVVLHEENRSGQSGTATLTDKGLSGTGVILEASAPKRFPGEVQPAAIHSARCAEIRGRRGFEELSATEVQPLTEVRDGRSETTAARSLAELGAGGYSITVHQPSPPFRAVVCGDIPKR